MRPAECRYCKERVAPDATKCPHCGERLTELARLRFEHDHVVIEEPGDMPIGVCFTCAEVGETRPITRARAPVAVPTCASCGRRAVQHLVWSGGVVLMGLMLLGASALLHAGVTPVLAVGLAVAAAVAAPVWVLHVRSVTVRAGTRDGKPVLLLPDARLVRRRVERDGI